MAARNSVQRGERLGGKMAVGESATKRETYAVGWPRKGGANDGNYERVDRNRFNCATALHFVKQERIENVSVSLRRGRTPVRKSPYKKTPWRGEEG